MRGSFAASANQSFQLFVFIPVLAVTLGGGCGGRECPDASYLDGNVCKKPGAVAEGGANTPAGSVGGTLANTGVVAGTPSGNPSAGLGAAASGGAGQGPATAGRVGTPISGVYMTGAGIGGVAASTGGSSVSSGAGGAGNIASVGGAGSGEQGGMVSTVPPCAPSTEVCDKQDNDCDGKVDENAVDEVCDGQNDEDCDDHIDEGCDCPDGKVRDCPKVSGVCVPGKQKCESGKWQSTCDDEVRGVPETCDGTDEDCDGTPDNGAKCSGARERCVAGECVSCTVATQAVDCPQSLTEPCQQNACAGTSCKLSPVKDGTACTVLGVPVGACSAGRCKADSEVVCEQFNNPSEAGISDKQFKFMDGSYRVCDPNHCLNTPGYAGFRCKTKLSGQQVLWTLADDSSARPISNVYELYPQGKFSICRSGGDCRKWFSEPHTKVGNVAVDCMLFDDGSPTANEVTNRRQMLPNREPFDGHEGETSVCTPEACRKWFGNCRVVQ
jgi:hypothetical protein